MADDSVLCCYVLGVGMRTTTSVYWGVDRSVRVCVYWGINIRGGFPELECV